MNTNSTDYTMNPIPTHQQANSASRILFASLIGTTIEFFDFYIYATAAVLVFPKLFFPAGDPTSATLQSLATFAVAFIARPIGSALFGHFGDRIGRKATLVAALLTMGLSTIMIGLLPTYAQIGVAAPLLLALCRFGQGLGLGGEWGGAVLLATENAPEGKRAWYGMFPQLGAPLGFILSGSAFLILSKTLTETDFFNWGWRTPFIASSLLVLIGLYIRLKIQETPVFQTAMEKEEKEHVPMLTVFKFHSKMLLLGTGIALPAFVVFYLVTVFALTWGTTALHYARGHFLVLQLIAILFFAVGIPVSAIVADRFGRRRTFALVSVLVIMFSFIMAPLFNGGTDAHVLAFLSLGLLLMGFTYGPLGTILSELFPTAVRYTGASLTFNLAGIAGASLAPYIAMWLAKTYGLQAVGYYMAAAAAISLIALLFVPETKEKSLDTTLVNELNSEVF
jgi:metabolite-proton symporter